MNAHLHHKKRINKLIDDEIRLLKTYAETKNVGILRLLNSVRKEQVQLLNKKL